MTKKNRLVNRSHLLGTVGLLLLLLLGKLVPLATDPPRTARQRAQSLLARGAIEAIATIGWLADRLPTGRSARRKVSTELTRPEQLSV